MKELSNTEAELKKTLLTKKVCISLVPLMIPGEKKVYHDQISWTLKL